MSTTLLTLKQAIARAGYGYVSVTPGVAGSSAKTDVISNGITSNLDPDDAETLYNSAWLKCESISTGTGNVGELRRLDKDNGYAPSTGTLTVTRAFSNASATTETYGIYLGKPPEDYGLERGLETYINDVLRRMFYHRPFLITLITDGDMETSGVTNWTATNCTRTKSTSTGVTLGKQALNVVNSAANGYVQSVTVNAEPGQTVLVAADVTISTGTAVLELWDVTNGASIDTETCEEFQSRRLWFIGDLPSTCRKVAVRLKGTESNANIYWDNVSLLNLTATEAPLPSWFTNQKWLEWVKVWRPGNTSAANNDRALDDIRRHPSVEAIVIEDKEGYVPYKVEYGIVVPSDALLIGQALSPYTELSADTDSTEANADWVKAWVLALIAEDRNDERMLKTWEPRAMALDQQHQVEWEGTRYQLQ